MDAVPSARLLKPITETIRHDGAPFVRLSPSKGMKNASILYESIRKMPDGTLIRGDFDKKGQPLVYFPDRPPKKLEVKLPILAKNIDADRREMASFLSSIVEAGYTSAKAQTRLIKATIDLKLKINAVNEQGVDFTVGDIRKSLATIAMAHNLTNVRKLTSPHRLLGKQDSRIQGKRFREFTQIDRKTFGRLSDALRPDSGGKYDTTPELAVYEMKQLLRDYRKRRLTENLAFSDFLRGKGLTPSMHFFARRWLEISSGEQTDARIKLSTEPWAKEMDRICPLIVREFRRGARIVSSEDRLGWLLYPSSLTESVPPLPPTPAPDSTNDGLGPMSPRQIMPAHTLEASVHTLPSNTLLAELSEGSPAAASLQSGPLDLGRGVGEFDIHASEVLDHVRPVEAAFSWSEILRDALFRRNSASRANSTATPALWPSLRNLADIPYSPLELHESEGETLSEPGIANAEPVQALTPEISVSDVSALGEQSKTPWASGSDRLTPSQSMSSPTSGYSPPEVSTTEEDE